MKIFVTGGTGFVGRTLTSALAKQGHEVTVLSRKSKQSNNYGISFIHGNPMTRGAWQDAVRQHEVIINLAGENIIGRWTRTKKKAIHDSRIFTTANLVEAISRRQGKETRLLNASAAGYYGPHGDEKITEKSPACFDFLALVGRKWEAEAKKAEAFGAKVTRCRFGIILGKNGGALKKMLPLFLAGLGSPLGSGKQWFSWLHIDDLIRIFLFLVDNPSITGAVNCTSPNPVRNSEFSRALSAALHRPHFMPKIPGFIIKIVMGEFGDILLKGQRVIPEKLMNSGFEFSMPDIKEALESLVK